MFFLQGMLHYSLVSGHCFAWMAVWWPRREHPSLAAAVGLTLGIMLLCLIHLSAGCLALLLVGLDLMLVVVQALRSAQPRAALRERANQLGLSALCIVAAGALMWQMGAATGSPYGGGLAGAVRRSWRNKAWSITVPFFTVTPWEMAVTATGYAFALASFIWMHRRVRAINVLGGLTASLEYST